MKDKEIKNFKDLQSLYSVERIEEVQDDYADYVVILCRSDTQQIRYYWLKYLRRDWEWLSEHTSHKHNNGFVHFKKKD